MRPINRRAATPPPTLQARRLDALWKAATNPTLSEAQRTQVMLTLGALSLRPGHPFTVRLERVDGDALVLEAGVDAATVPLAPGSRLPVADSPQAELIRINVIRGWYDVRRSPEIARCAEVRAQGWQAVIGMPFQACGAVYTLTFVSPQPLASDFESDDRDFVELLASTLAERIQQRWQNQRIEAFTHSRTPVS